MGVAFKFGYCESKRERLANMNEGWPIGDQRAPALAVCCMWRWVFSQSGPKEAETELLDKLAKSYPVSRLTAALQAEMIEQARMSGVPRASENLNGVGEIRIVGDDAVFDPDGWIVEAQLRSPSAILVFKQACRFGRRIRKCGLRPVMPLAQFASVIYAA